MKAGIAPFMVLHTLIDMSASQLQRPRAGRLFGPRNCALRQGRARLSISSIFTGGQCAWVRALGEPGAVRRHAMRVCRCPAPSKPGSQAAASGRQAALPAQWLLLARRPQPAPAPLRPRPAGIVQGKAKVRAVERKPEFCTFEVEFPAGRLAEVQTGGSIALNGTCLTVVGAEVGPPVVLFVAQSSAKARAGPPVVVLPLSSPLSTL